MADIERKITEGNTTAYYQDLGLYAEIKLQIGKEDLNVYFQYEPQHCPTSGKPGQFHKVISIEYNNMGWLMSGNNGKLSHFSPVPTRSDNSPQEREATNWCIAHDEFHKQSEKRLKKLQKTYAYVCNKINQNPLIKRYIENYEDYYNGEKEKIMKKSRAIDERTKERDAKIKEEFKNKPDPIEGLVALIESEQIN